MKDRSAARQAANRIAMSQLIDGTKFLITCDRHQFINEWKQLWTAAIAKYAAEEGASPEQALTVFDEAAIALEMAARTIKIAAREYYLKTMELEEDDSDTIN